MFHRFRTLRPRRYSSALRDAAGRIDDGIRAAVRWVVAAMGATGARRALPVPSPDRRRADPRGLNTLPIGPKPGQGRARPGVSEDQID